MLSREHEHVRFVHTRARLDQDAGCRKLGAALARLLVEPHGLECANNEALAAAVVKS